ncbi:MAG: ABC transporter ATP-binding protein [Cumulibacter sp.]
MIRALLSLLAPDARRQVVRYQILAVIGLVLRAAGAVLLVPLIGALFGSDPADAWVWVGVLTLVTIAGWIVDSAVARLGFGIGFGLLDTGQRTVADQVAAIRRTWFTAEHTATTRQAIAATGPDLVGLVIYLITPLLGATLLPIAIGTALLFIAWPLGLVALLGVPILLGAFWAANRLGRNADQAASAANTELTERVVEFARTQQALRAARRVEPARSHAGAALHAQRSAARRLLLMQIPGQIIFAVASQVALVALAATTVVLTTRGDVTVAEAIALIVVIVRYLEPFTVLAELSPGIETTLTTMRRIVEVLRAPLAPTGSHDLATNGAPRVQLRGVEFGYSPDSPPVLSEFDLTFEPGTTTAIVGPSGSGKSTVLALLAGLQHPNDGQVLIDGADAATLSSDSRRELISVVFQDPYLFDGTISQNVLVGAPDASPDAVAAAGELARLTPMIASLPDGWDSRVGEAGTSLSGGERQRVSIARALLKPAPLLLVDEATSALDNENEAAVAAALSNDPTPRTRVIVAHRLSSIRAADRVVFLEAGRIVEDGTISELLDAGGRFADFWTQQHAALQWRLSSAAHRPVQLD